MILTQPPSIDRITGAEFLKLFRTDSFPTLDQARELSERIAKWRASVPRELLIDQISELSAENVWIIFLLAMSFRLECLLYRNLRRRDRTNAESVSWADARLTLSIFELDTLLKRAVVHGVVQYCPPSL